MGDGRGTEFARCLDQVLGDDGTREGGDEGVLAFVKGVGLERGHAVLVCEFVASVGDVGFDGATVESALTNDLEVFASLADIDGDGDDLAAGLLADPSDGDGGVQAA